MNILDEIKDSFKEGSSLAKLVYINVGMFLAIKVITIVFFLLNMPQGEFEVIKWLAVPASLPQLATKFWTPFSYMFLHEGFLHILFNMLWLFWFGKIFLEYFDQKKLTTIYLLGGLSGAVLYIFSFNVFPAFEKVREVSIALGASAAVMAIVIATATYVPKYVVRLVLIGPVQIKYIAIGVLFFTSVLDFATNTGGKIAHLGGALFGFLYVIQYKKGKDIGKWFDKLMDSLVSIIRPRPKLKVKYKKPPNNDFEYKQFKASQQKQVDEILEKISKGGYSSLTKKEKEILFKMSENKK
ncbi:MAG: rhomboid family intramembrane serine protease [Bacteroidetes bacterium]|nr:MAG: rhomboid family intramembrane serine protease [Bacteroidota bacterium]